MRPSHALLLVFLAFAVYSNAFDHAFNLDSSHVLVDNPMVRSLEHVPAYFRDPATLSVNRSNAGYMPILQVSYALNYQLSGYRMWSWHLLQVLLHIAAALGLLALGERVLATLPEDERRALRYAPFTAAALFTIHPVNAGVVSYLCARPSLLLASFLFPALWLYMVDRDAPGYARPAVAPALLAALALWTKIQAVPFVATFFLWDVWQCSTDASSPGAGRRGFFASVWAACNRVTLLRLAPSLLVLVAYAWVYHHAMSPFEMEQARATPGVTGWHYLCTQTVVWWRYVGQWFAPVRLVADDASYPVYRTLFEPVVLLAVGAWALFAGGLLARWRRAPHEAFLAICALALLSPTSSVMPLSEMHNEHRPYMPLALLSVLWVFPAVRSLTRWRSGLAVGGVLVAAVGLAGLTVQRNRVFADAESYWKDILAKAPSARAHNNYALAMQGAGRPDEAAEHFEAAVRDAPTWHVPLINWALELERRGDVEGARAQLDRAVAGDAWSRTARVWRGEFRLRHGDRAGAEEDFLAVLEQTGMKLRVHRGLAQVAAYQGDAAACLRHVAAALALDRGWMRLQIVPVLNGFFSDPAHAQAGIEFLDGLEALLPGEWWVAQNKGALLLKLGRAQEAGQQFEEAQRRRGPAAASAG